MSANDLNLKQGEHLDPLAPDYQPPDPATMSDDWKLLLTSPRLAMYREALLLPGVTDPRAAVLDDLSVYYQMDPDECVRRCLNWEAWSVQEWTEADRSTPEGMRAFYNSTQSWSFDLVWYAYLQAIGARHPAAIIATTALDSPARAPRVLDFGSGAGDLSQFLIALGYTVDLADASQSLLTFAQWRLERRGQQAGYIDLNSQQLPSAEYDAILAKDVLVHVPHYQETVRDLHRALKPGGVLVANFDTRPPSPENAWHLYDDDTMMRRGVQDAGFEQIDRLDGYLFVYRRVEPVGLPHMIRRVRNSVLLGPPRKLLRRARTVIRDRVGR